jgi:hypothetical protein
LARERAATENGKRIPGKAEPPLTLADLMKPALE